MNNTSGTTTATEEGYFSFYGPFLVLVGLVLVVVIVGAFASAKLNEKNVLAYVTSALATAKAETHPVKRYEQLSEASQKGAMDGCQSDNPFSNKGALERRCDELHEAIAMAQKEALVYAKEQAPTTNDVVTLKYLATEYEEGKHVTRDSSRAIGLFTRAYAQGDIESAKSISSLFTSQRDMVNAYMWALRCLGCQISAYQISELARDLTADQIRLAETAAGGNRSRVDD